VRGKVEDVVEEHRIAREIAVHEIYPLIKDQIGDLEIIREMVSAGLNPRQSTSVQPVTGSSTISVPNSNALQFLLQTRMIWYEASIHETRDFQNELEEIQAMLKQEMLRLGGEVPISHIQQ
jgi:hypothetical protein